MEFFSKKNEKVEFLTVFPDKTEIYFNLLTFEEYEILSSYRNLKKMDDISFYEEVYNLCVPSMYKNVGGQLRAGIAYSIGQFIWEQSNNSDSLIEELETERAAYNPGSVYEFMKSVIITAYENYKYEDFDRLNRKQLIKLFVRAESYLSQKNPEYKPLNLKKELAKAKRKGAGIDFEKENRELAKEVGSFTEHVNSPQTSQELLRIRENAAVRHNSRLEKIKNG